MGRRVSVVVCVFLMAVGTAAYDRFGINYQENNCRICHRTGVLHDFGHDEHQAMVDVDCYVCHTLLPPWNEWDHDNQYTGSSFGGTGMAGLGCVGCHGRPEDGTGTGTQGWGAGLRQSHWLRGNTFCGNCHTDANPASKTPVAESVIPPYYASPGVGHPSLPNDPCNPPPDYREGIFIGLTRGLDNDGDGVYDEYDFDCDFSDTPGETASTGLDLLVVESHDRTARSMSISYGIACQTSDNNIELGPLDQVSAYNYTTQVCSIGNTGTYDWSYPTSPDAFFFLVVGNDLTVEGSYGIGDGGERPEDKSNVDCPLSQELRGRCD